MFSLRSLAHKQITIVKLLVSQTRSCIVQPVLRNFNHDGKRNQKNEETQEKEEEKKTSKHEQEIEEDLDVEEPIREGKKQKLLEWLFNVIAFSLVGYGSYKAYKYFSAQDKTPIEIAREKISNWMKDFTEPVVEKLLPDIPDDVPEYARKPVLVIALEDVLLRTTYTPEHGWRTQKRPGLDVMLQRLSEHYELVLFSEGYMLSVLPIIEKVDPNGFATKLFRENMLYKDGHIIKDLSRMNRPLNKILMIDYKPEAYELQPENALPIQKWQGQTSDNFLFELVPLLEHLATSGASDYREVVQQIRTLPGDTIEEKIHNWNVATARAKAQQAQQQSWLPGKFGSRK